MPHRIPWLATALVGGYVVCALVSACRGEGADTRSERENQPEPERPSAPASTARHVGSQRCQSCHPGEYARWQTSHHQESMAVAPGPVVRGDFADTVYQAPDITARFTSADGSLFASLGVGEPGEQRYRVSYTLGHTPLQQYLIEFPDGRLQVFPVAWDTRAGRFFQFHSDDGGGRDPSMHWQGVFNNWNLMCATCHVTDLHKRYDPESNRYATTWSEISVGCEACHGPAEEHLRWADDQQLQIANRGLVAVQQRGGVIDEVAVCGPCHSRRQAITEQAPVGAPYYDHFVPALLREGLYFADGQIQDEVFVLGSFLQSKMFHRGVSCRNCHDPHSGQLIQQEPGLCTRCHAAPLYDTRAHHFHEPGTDGSRCVSCHMPERTYMGVDARRDHSFRVPRPDLSARLDTPNACNQCHTGETAQWAAAAIARVHGPRAQGDGLEVAEILAAARRRDPDAAGALMTLAADRNRPAIVRATALELLQSYPGAQPARAARIFTDGLHADQPLVRLASVDGTSSLAPQERAIVLAPLLRDKTRAVRIQAARALVDLESRMAPESQALSWYRQAIEEYQAAQRANLDHPGARFNLGALHDARGDTQRAASEYRAALSLAPAHVPSAVNLAAILERRNQPEAAAEVLAQALRHIPESGELHHALGLIRAGQRRFDDAVYHLEHAIERLPADPALQRSYQAALRERDGAAGSESAPARRPRAQELPSAEL